MLLMNIRHAWRQLRGTPGVTTVAVVTLALGIGANSAVFSVIDAVMLKPLAYPNPDRLVALWESSGAPNFVGTQGEVSPANLVDYVRDAQSFDGLAGYAASSMSLTKIGAPEQLRGESITWNYFAVLGGGPVLGRAFRPEEDRPGAARVVILTDGLWRQRFGADAAILGRPIWLDNEAYEIVGVTAAGFTPLTGFGSTTPVSYFVPAAYPDALLTNHGNHEIDVVGRLKDGVTFERAQAELDAISAGLAERFPETNSRTRAMIAELSVNIARNVRGSLLILMAAVGVVALVACVNVANLLIVRVMGQQREVAVRMSLGATRAQIVADILTRGVVLAVLGGGVGLLVGVWVRDWLAALAPATTPRLDELALSSRVLLASSVLSLVAGVFASLLPAWHLSRTDPAPALKASATTASVTRVVLHWRGALMAIEIAAAIVLAIGAGLLARSLIRANSVELGFQTGQVVTLNVRLPQARYPDAARRFAFFRDLAERVHLIPGVQSVAFANRFPMLGGWGGSFMMNGPSGLIRDDADFQAVSPGYFATLRIPLVRGRLLSEADQTGTLPVAVVSETFVKRFIPDRDPIGQEFRRTEFNFPAISIVGVVAEVRRDGKEANVVPQVYLAAAQTLLYPVQLTSFAVRTEGAPRALVPAIQRAVWAIDPDQPVTGVRTLDEVLSASMAERRFHLLLLTSFAGLAFVLSLLGVYGVVAYAAAQRTKEVGIRVALGAARRDVVVLVVASGLRWSVAGVAIGLGSAAAVTRIMRAMLFGVEPTDPLTFAVVATAMISVALVASYVPARRAAGIDPAAALRTE